MHTVTTAFLMFCRESISDWKASCCCHLTAADTKLEFEELSQQIIDVAIFAFWQRRAVCHTKEFLRNIERNVR